jgi:hypothetical protein
MAGVRWRRAPEARPPPPPSGRRRHRRVCPGEPPAAVAVPLDGAALGQSAEPHGDPALVAAGCLRPLHDAASGSSRIASSSARSRAAASSTPGLKPRRRLERERDSRPGSAPLGFEASVCSHCAIWPRTEPVQDRVDSVAQRAKLSPVHHLSPFSRCAFFK